MQEQQKYKEQFTSQELFILFEESCKRHGVAGLSISFANGNFVMTQQTKTGIRGLGYDKNESSLWLCLDQGDFSIKNNRWNQNSIFELNDHLKDVSLLQDGKNLHITLNGQHPVACLARLIGRTDKVFLPGQYNDWNRSNNPFKPHYEKDSIKLVLDLADIDKLGECKIAITDCQCEWDSGEWKNNNEQKLIVFLD